MPRNAPRCRRQNPALLLGLSTTALLAASGCASLQTARHPDFKSRQPTIQSLAILPPDIRVYKLSFKGDQELMHDLLDPLAQQITEALHAGLEQRGYRPHILDVDAPDTAPELKRNLHTLRELFGDRLDDYRKRWFRKFRAFDYGLGSDVNEFADLTNSDALVLTRCVAFKKTGGEITKDWAESLLIATATLGSLVVINYPSVTVVELAVVDGNTGEVLWFTDNGGGAPFDIARERKFRKYVRKLMARFPKAASADHGRVTRVPGTQHPTDDDQGN